MTETIYTDVIGKIRKGIKPRNPVTDQEYKGANAAVLHLEAADKGYSRDEWVTFSQAKELGLTVREGEKGTFVVLTFPVFNLDQLETPSEEEG